MGEFSIPRRDLRRAKYRARRLEHDRPQRRIVVFRKTFALSVGYFACLAGLFVLPPFDDAAGSKALVIARTFCIVFIIGSVIALSKISKATGYTLNWLSWFALFTGCILGVGVGIGILIMLIEAAL